MRHSYKKLFSLVAVLFLAFSPIKISFVTKAEDVLENETVDNTLKYYLGESKNTGDDDGFTGAKKIDKGDNHFGWKLGQFFVSGYTRCDDFDASNPIFLKNVGDTVKLSFNLEQDISKLNGNGKLSINNDKKAYDEYFGIKESSFGKGALIIRYTDYENNKGEPVIYTNYLKGIEKGADTEVQLCEEGDYEIALDYSIRSEIVGDLWKIPTSNIVTFEDDYRIFFKFSVRNGNCMVYPFDISTGKELTNTAFTKNGFRLDLARSRYLNIDIRKQVMNSGKDGLIEDTRFNKPAKDGEEFKDEGIYIITVSNKYTNRTTEKTIYVGDDPIMQAFASNSGYTIAELNNMVAEGAVINDDGTIEIPVTTTTTETIETTTTKQIIETTATVIQGETVTESATTSLGENISDGSAKKEIDNKVSVPVVAGCTAAVAVIVTVIFVINKRKGSE